MILLAHQFAWLLTTVSVIVALNLVAGKAGVWSVGHVAFFGIGAYATAWVLETFGGRLWDIATGIVLASALAGGLSFLIARTALRLRQDFFVILSFALLELVRNFAISWKGPDGFQRLPPIQFVSGRNAGDWELILALIVPFTVVVAWLAARAERGPIHRAFALVRTSEEAALMLGRSPLALKRLAFVASAVIMAVAGGLYTCFAGGTEPAKLLLPQALLLFAALLLGGLNSTLGAVVGALILVIVPRVLEATIFAGPTASYYAAQGQLVLFGLLLIVVIHRYPAGLAGRNEVLRRV